METLYIKQSLNNNIVIALDNQENEVIVIGNGIGFSKKKGDVLDTDKIDKVFYYIEKKQEKEILDLLKNIPVNYLLITDKIIKYAEKNLQKKLSNTFLIALADHIKTAVERAKTNNIIENSWGEEIKFLYPNEYKIAIKSLKYIEKSTETTLSKDEIIFLTIHFVNAQSETSNIQEILQISSVISKVVQLLKSELPEKIDEESLTFNRFLVHLRYFVIRQRETIDMDSKDELTELYELARKKYSESYRISEKVTLLLESELEVKLGNDEKFYLVLHIQRLIKSIGE